MWAASVGISGLVCLTLSGCGSDTTTVKPFGTCGNAGGGTVPCDNNPNFQCTDCGTNPCVSADQGCYSCYSTAGCFTYRCETTGGARCQNTPCSQNCGTGGGDRVPTQNRPDLTCSNCGPVPCAGASGECYSCYGADENCYKYACNGGAFCQTEPCGFLSSDGNVTRVPAWQPGKTFPDSSKGEALDGTEPAMNETTPELNKAIGEGVPAWQPDDDFTAIPV